MSAAEHRAKVRRRNAWGVPWKWEAVCSCGWHCLSWSWSRAVEADHYGRDQYIVENGHAEGGALVMAMQHVGLAS